jgi:hypothetical protein
MFLKIKRKGKEWYCKMKGKLDLVLGVFLVFGFLLTGCATAGTASTQAQQEPVLQNEGPVNDRRFDGRWQSHDGEFELEFYADTYILFEYNTDRTQSRVGSSGVFNYSDNEIDCQVKPGMHFVLIYSLAGPALTVTAGPATPDFLAGQWKKISAPVSGETNPLVGTWKCKTGDGFTFYQFYPDGSGRSYVCNENLTNMTLAGDIKYDLSTSAITGFLEGSGGIGVPLINAPFSLNGDELTQGKLVLKRQ